MTTQQMTYQVSYVVRGEKGSGEITQSDHYPAVGEQVMIQGQPHRIIEIEELIPPRSRFCYVHALCEPL